MNKILFLLLLFSTKAMACICNTPNDLSTNFMHADFVAKIKIIKKHKNINNNDYYKADIKILDLYKGDSISLIYIYGNNGRSFESSCDRQFDENEIIILFSKKDKKEHLLISQCTHVLKLVNEKSNFDNVYNRNDIYANDIKILERLKANKINFTNSISFQINDFYSFLGEIDLKERKNNFAIYEVIISKDLKTKCIRKIAGLGRKIDLKIKKNIKGVIWQRIKQIGNNELNDDIKYLVILQSHFYTKEGKDYLLIK